jgi:hypothetical protein
MFASVLIDSEVRTLPSRTMTDFRIGTSGSDCINFGQVLGG